MSTMTYTEVKVDTCYVIMKQKFSVEAGKVVDFPEPVRVYSDLTSALRMMIELKKIGKVITEQGTFLEYTLKEVEFEHIETITSMG